MLVVAECNEKKEYKMILIHGVFQKMKKKDHFFSTNQFHRNVHNSTETQDAASTSPLFFNVCLVTLLDPSKRTIFASDKSQRFAGAENENTGEPLRFYICLFLAN